LDGLAELLPTLSQDITNVVVTMTEGYKLATTNRKTGSRMKLLEAAPFLVTCTFTCMQEATYEESLKVYMNTIRGRTDKEHCFSGFPGCDWASVARPYQQARAYQGQKWEEKCWKPVRDVAPQWSIFYGMLLGYRTLASQLASIDVLIDSIVQDAIARSAKRFLDKTYLVRNSIKNTVAVVNSRSEKLTKLNYAEDCATLFDSAEPHGCTAKGASDASFPKRWVKGHWKFAPFENTYKWITRWDDSTCRRAACASSTCYINMFVGDWF